MTHSTCSLSPSSLPRQLLFLHPFLPAIGTLFLQSLFPALLGHLILFRTHLVSPVPAPTATVLTFLFSKFTHLNGLPPSHRQPSQLLNTPQKWVWQPWRVSSSSCVYSPQSQSSNIYLL